MSEEQKEEKLAVFGLKKMFGRKTAVAGIDFSMSKGEIVGFLGQNGAGKTTAFYMIAGFIKPTEGKIMLGDRELSKLPMYKRAQLGISYLPQEASIFRKLTVEENIAAIIVTRSDLNRKEKKALLEELIEEFGIGHIRKQKAFTLSGGERRRTEIARALSMKPKFLLLDEPFSGIDPIAVSELRDTFFRLNREKEVTLMVSSHILSELYLQGYRGADHRPQCAGYPGYNRQSLHNQPWTDHGCRKQG